jgi:hypothetical protein
LKTTIDQRCGSQKRSGALPASRWSPERRPFCSPMIVGCIEPVGILNASHVNSRTTSA